MIFDYFAALDCQEGLPKKKGKYSLSSGFVDLRTVQSITGSVTDNGDLYRQEASQSDFNLPDDLNIDCPPPLPLSSWALFKVEFELLAPWYSKDDRLFHVLDNPIRKDRVFGVPFMSATSWKGLLRWTCRMESGLLEHLVNDEQLRGWQDPPWIVHLFGQTHADGEEFSPGVLQFFPTWFDKIGFEMINPHDRARRTGTHPITFEVVPAQSKGSLQLLYAPTQPLDNKRWQDALENLLVAIEKLLTVYGFSAKRTAGWGISNITHCSVAQKNQATIEGDIQAVKSQFLKTFSKHKGAK